jgi:hypothetical protein
VCRFEEKKEAFSFAFPDDQVARISDVWASGKGSVLRVLIDIMPPYGILLAKPQERDWLWWEYSYHVRQ